MTSKSKSIFRVAGAVWLLAEAAMAGVVKGELKQWHKVVVDFEGPAASESGNPNPFTDFRLQVEFTGPGGAKYSVPGFFAADGNAGETGATSGRTWRVNFAPDRAGEWRYKASFRTGPGVAVADGANPGTATAFDGDAGAFTVGPSDKSGRDLRSKGYLQYVGRHHLRFAGSGEYFLKAGADSPENFLAYQDIDGTSKSGGGTVKNWAPHVKDWRAGDPTWMGGKGKGIIGAINYLASKGMNVFSFLTLNINGDGKDVWMYTGYGERERFDCSKLDQWEVIFGHGERMGMYLHFKTQETENDKLLDGGELGPQRKLYYRELVARFSHHMALNWNLGEETKQSAAQHRAMSACFRALDPYGHPVVLHTFPPEHEKIYRPLLGPGSDLTGISIQTAWDNAYASARKWVQESAAAGKKWVVANDEQGGANQGVAADADYAGDKGSVADNRSGIRRETLWGNLMAGGAGVEYYFGYQTGETDLTAQDFRSREKKWDDARHALEFFTENTPFWEMTATDGVASRGWCLAKKGAFYVVYLGTGGSATLDLAGAQGSYEVKWYNPRSGQFDGSPTTVAGGGKRSLGNPPSEADQDWAVLIRNTESTVLVSPSGQRVSRRTLVRGSGGEMGRVWYSMNPEDPAAARWNTQGRILPADGRTPDAALRPRPVRF